MYMDLFKSTLSKPNYDQEKIAASESYFIYIKECLISDNSMFGQYWN